MADYDLFNGDADGICSLVQLRLAEPREATLVTGVKRQIKLLDHLLDTVEVGPDDHITVLDVSMDKNKQALNTVLSAGAEVFYVDHHRSGEIPDNPALEAHINIAANTCTGLIVDYYLEGRFRDWAIVAAYGDNILTVADDYANRAGYSQLQKTLLKQLGIAMNYNGYGATANDLFYHPAELYRIAVQFDSPFDMIESRYDVFTQLTQGYKEDMERGLSIEPLHCSENVSIIVLPDEPWARRVSGVLGNELANQYPDRAHAVLTELNDEQGAELRYMVSLRAPKANSTGAVDIAVKFGGGGRAAAAGIDVLPYACIDALILSMKQQYAGV